MPISCIACDRPVHPDARKCPHCGELSGARPSKLTAAETFAIAAAEEARFQHARALATPPAYAALMRPADTGIDTIAEIIELSLDFPAAMPVAKSDPIPRAQARIRRPPAAETRSAARQAPEPTDAPASPDPESAPDSEPRFLK